MKGVFFTKVKNKNLISMLLALVLVVGQFCFIGQNVSAAETLRVEINGYQISTTVEGFRTIYSVVDPYHQVVKEGLIYGLADHVTEADMVINSTNNTVYSYEATEAGITPVCYSKYDNAQSYTMTMRFIKKASFYNQKIAVKAYAQLSNGTYIYSAMTECSVYQLADNLYTNKRMNNVAAHKYLYENILTVVNPSYKEQEYDWNASIVDPGELSGEQTTTKEAETKEPETLEIPTEPQTTVPETPEIPTEPETTEPETPEIPTEPETTTPEITTEFVIDIPDADKATGAPGEPKITHNQYQGDVDGDYDISVSMWYGNNATCYVLYERKGKAGEYQPVRTGNLTDDTPSAQNFTISITGKTIPGTYWYYIEYINQFGRTSSNEISVVVGSSTTSRIILEKIDDDEIANQYVMAQGTDTFTIEYSESEQCAFEVISSNQSAVKASIVNGNQLKLEAIGGGRAGIKLVEVNSKEERYFGVRVREADGTLASMPSYLALGQVSEDSTGDLNFWKGIAHDDTNKRVDVRYIYINGGPISGWQSWSPDEPEKRVRSYIVESLKLGIVPYFVYYNIPDAAEDYNVDTAHMNDKSYMEAYYKDLVFFLETCKKYAAGETVGIILEPDFLGYMMQQAGKAPKDIVAAGVEGAYSSGVLTKGEDPDFPNTLVGIVESINYIIQKTYPSANFGWQFNTWSYSDGVPGQGLMHSTEKMGYEQGRAFIKNAAEMTANFYMSAGILSYGADFISIDKYGLDGAYQGDAAQNPEASNWLWNNDLWNNYLYYTKILHETTNMPVTLWQLPVGHLNHSLEQNPYNNGLFADLTNKEQNYEDSAPTFFFGDTFEPGSAVRLEYFTRNATNDGKIQVNGNTVTYGSHMEEARDAGITCILFGAGVGASTDAVGDPPGDNYWWITKAQRYYNNPVPLK